MFVLLGMLTFLNPLGSIANTAALATLNADEPDEEAIDYRQAE